MKKIEDYLHLYLGAECQTPAGKGLLTNVGNHHDCTINIGYDFFFSLSKVKPILRPLSDMTEEERNELIVLQYDSNKLYHEMAAQVRYLLSKHFDLFDLIPSGLAIDKIKIKKPV